MGDEMERIGDEVERQLEQAQEISETYPAGQELPWVIPRSRLESMKEDELHEVLIDTRDKMGRLLGAVNRLGANDPEIQRILNPPKES